MTDQFDCWFWKNYKYYRRLETKKYVAHAYSVVLFERDAIYLGMDNRMEWPHPDAGERKEYCVAFINHL